MVLGVIRFIKSSETWLWEEGVVTFSFKIKAKSSAEILAYLSSIMMMFPAFMYDLYDSLTIGVLKPLHYFLFALAIIFGIMSLYSLKKICIPKRQLAFFAPWFLILFVSLLRNGDLERGSFASSMRFAFIILFTLLVVSKSNFDEKIVIKCIFIYMIIQLALGYYFLAFPNTLIEFASNCFYFSTRNYKRFVGMVNQGCFMGIAAHYSGSGMYMATGTILSFAFLLAERKSTGTYHKCLLALFILFCTALLLTQKRAHLIFSLISMAVMYLVGFVEGNQSKRLKQLMIGFFIAAVFAVYVSGSGLFEKTLDRFVVVSSANDTMLSRVNILWLPSINQLASHPIIGIGWRQFKYLNSANNDTHNVYLQLLCENGLIIGMAIIGFLFWTYYITWKRMVAAKKREGNSYLPILFSFGYQTFFLFYCLTGNPLYDIQCLFPYLVCYAISLKDYY